MTLIHNFCSTYFMYTPPLWTFFCPPIFSRKWSIRDAHLTHPTENISSIRSTTLFFSSTHLRDARFCNNYTKTSSKTTHFRPHFCLFITNQISDFPSQKRLSQKNKGRKSLANHLYISHSSHFIGKIRKHSHSLRQLFSWSARIKVKFVLWPLVSFTPPPAQRPR